MKSWFKRSEPEPIRRDQGNALPTVLFFAAIGLITVFTYLFHQLSISRPTLRSPASVQALLNARSGIYKAFQQFIDSTSELSDTLKTIDTRANSFGEDLFPIDTRDTGLSLGDTHTDMKLYASDSFGTCEVSSSPQGSFYMLEATGKFQNIERSVSAKLGSKIPALPDTVVLYYNDLPWEGKEPNGKVVQIKEEQPKQNSKLLDDLVAQYKTQIQLQDTALMDPPLTIQSNNDLQNIPDQVNGALLLDGSYVDLVWKADRKIVVLGDLQITGETQITGLEFIVAGEIKILDKTVAHNITVFSQSRIFIGDYSVFQGDALAIHSITVYGKARIEGKSSLVVSGQTSAGTGSTKDSTQYSMFLAEESSIDAVCMALGKPGGIKTDENVIISGLLWAQNAVCHRGRMNGLIRAGQVIDCDQLGQVAPLTPEKADTAKGTVVIRNNAVPGSISPLNTIEEYQVPFFAGIPSIIDWKEE